MPTYADSVHGVSMSDALLEAAAIARIDSAMLDAFSLAHPLIDTIYFVNDYQPLVATLEDGVTVVTFEACPIRMSRATESAEADSPQITIDCDNISGVVSDALRIIRASRDPWVLTNYLYNSEDTSGPAVMPPTVKEFFEVSVNERTASLTAAFGDAGNKAIPATTFKRSEYPGLVRAR